jgi:hypothetical protein
MMYDDVETFTLFRPVGQREFELIQASEYREYPQRPPAQPIFYLDLNEAYATHIAREWNTKDVASGYMARLTRVQVRLDYLSAYSVKMVGNPPHQELWIPVEELPEFNANIVGFIEVIAEFRGD